MRGAATRTFDWSGRSPMSWSQFLQAQEFERSLRFEIRESVGTAIATASQLDDSGFRRVEEALQDGLWSLESSLSAINDGVREGTSVLLEEVRYASGRISAEIAEAANLIDQRLEWGFSALLLSLGETNAYLARIEHLVRNPAQTFANEQFRVALENRRRGLYPEALEAVRWAIDGHGGNLGQKTDFRFHFLEGEMRLGGARNADPAVVDPQASEAAFLLAARYARADFPLEAGRALVCAAHAALAQKRPEAALAHCEAAIAAVSLAPAKGPSYAFDDIKLTANHAPAACLAGKILCVLGQRARGEKFLAAAFVLSPATALSAESDVVMATRAGARSVLAAVAAAKGHLDAMRRDLVDRFTREWSRLEAYQFADQAAGRFLAEEIRERDEAIRRAEAEEGSGTLWGVARAGDVLADNLSKVCETWEKARSRYISVKQEELKKEQGVYEYEIRKIEKSLEVETKNSKERQYRDVKYFHLVARSVGAAALTITVLMILTSGNEVEGSRILGIIGALPGLAMVVGVVWWLASGFGERVVSDIVEEAAARRETLRNQADESRRSTSNASQAVADRITAEIAAAESLPAMAPIDRTWRYG